MLERILAIDFGLKRIGLAVSDALGITAQGLPTLHRTRLGDDLSAIQALAARYSVREVIVGDPRGHSGQPTAMASKAARFRDLLQKGLRLEVKLWDERLTSVEANRLLKSAGLSQGKRLKAVDQVAATLLLQNYLDWRNALSK